MVMNSKPQEDPAMTSLMEVWRFAWARGLRQEIPLCVKWFAAAACALAPALVTPMLLGQLMEGVSGGGNDAGSRHPWVTFAWWAALLLLIGPAASLFEKLQSVRLDLAISRRLRREAYAAVLNKPLRYFHEQDRGALIFLLRDVCSECQVAIRQLTLDGFLLVFQLVASATLVVWNFVRIAGDSHRWTNAGLAVLLLTLGLVAPLVVGRFAKRFQAVSAGLREANQASMSLLEGSLRSPEEMKAFDASDRCIGKYDASLLAINDRRVRQTRAVSMANVLNSLPTDFVQVVLLAAALFLSLRADGSSAPLVSILLLAPQVMRPLQGFSAFAMIYHTSLPSLTKLMQLLASDLPADTPQRIPVEATDEPVRSAPAIEASQVHFQYPGTDTPTLNDFSLHIAPGTIAALVAQKGAGKTTFFRLLLNFYRPQSGQIQVTGRPVEEWAEHELRQRVGYMAQFPSFTHETVRENLLLAAPLATDEEMVGVVRQLGLGPVLERQFGPAPGFLDQGFASGQMLSGGEKKLFALARCLLRRPTVLLLDEPTTGLDNMSKTPLAEVIRKLAPAVTLLIVDHDVEWLHQLCDQIAVIEHGKIGFLGAPEEAARSNELYQVLLRTPEEQPISIAPPTALPSSTAGKIWAEAPPSPGNPPLKGAG